MKNNKATSVSRLGKFSLLTLVAIYFLILVGGIVRTTGSGMGCPDWPKCFGSWVPPTAVEQLPSDYKDIYSAKRAAKNEKLVGYLSFLGFDSTADKIANDKSILKEADFNATKTWIEYINRLIGALIGLFIIGTVWLAYRAHKEDKNLLYLAIAAFVLVLFQGWLGSLVVSTNLIPFMVSIHMLFALIIVGILSAIVVKANQNLKVYTSHTKELNTILIVSMIIMLTQILLGTQVRESIDHLSAALVSRINWVDNLGLDFIIHRSFSWIVLLVNVFLVYRLYKYDLLNTTAKSILAVVIITILSGASMSFFGVPAFLQPIHLLLGSVGIGLQFFLFLQLQNKATVNA